MHDVEVASPCICAVFCPVMRFPAQAQLRGISSNITEAAFSTHDGTLFARPMLHRRVRRDRTKDVGAEFPRMCARSRLRIQTIGKRVIRAWIPSPRHFYPPTSMGYETRGSSRGPFLSFRLPKPGRAVFPSVRSKMAPNQLHFVAAHSGRVLGRYHLFSPTLRAMRFFGNIRTFPSS